MEDSSHRRHIIGHFWHYWRENINAAKEGHEMIVLIVFIIWQTIFWLFKIAGLDVGIFGEGSSKKLEHVERISALLFAMWGLLWLPFIKFEREQKKYAEKMESLTEQFKEALQLKHAEADALQHALDEKESTSLKIEACRQEMVSGVKRICQISIFNESTNQTIDGVEVRIVSLEDSLTEAEGKIWRPVYPYKLKADVSDPVSINPGSDVKFNFATVFPNDGIRRDGEQTIHYKNFTAYFSNERFKEITQFTHNKDYQLRLAITARNLPPIAREFRLRFVDDGVQCFYDLNTI